MQKQIALITMAIFAMSILIVQSFYTYPQALAQLTFTTTSITYTGNSNDQSNCHYVDSEESWCTSTSGIKIINPTSQSVSTTLYSGITIQDVDCTTSFCYSWHNGDTATANLTQWSISTRQIVNTTTFTMSGGAPVGRQIDALSAQGAENILLPASSTSCIGSGGTSLKGLCIFDGTIFESSRFISSGDSGASAVLFNIKWSETLATVGEPTLNNALIAFQDGGGTRTIKIINLADADTTFATTQTCSASGASLSATETFQIFVYNENYYIPLDLGATGAYGEVPIDSTTCVTTSTYPTTWDIPVALITDGEFFYTASTDGATSKSSFQVYNSSSSALATYNITNTSAPALPVKNGWYHSTEGEVQIIGNNRLIIFRTQAGQSPNEEFCSLPENANILICRLEESPPLTGASELLNQSSTNIVCMIGLLSCTQDSDGNFTPDNPDIKTNGVGYLITIIAFGILISIFWLASGGRLGDIPTFVWFIATLAILGLMVGFDFLDVTFLLIGVIAIVALAVAKAKGIFGDVGLFKGE